MKRTFVLVYDTCALFEVTVLSYLMSTVGEVKYVGVSREKIVTFEGITIEPDVQLSEIDISDIDLLVVPGGNAQFLINNDHLCIMLRKTYENNGIIAAICSGVVQLAYSGIIGSRKFTTSVEIDELPLEQSVYIDADVVVDGNIVTAKAKAFVEFGIEVGKIMNIYKDTDDYLETVNFFKNVN